jgi:sugar lactone lactonase YvrE
MTDAAQVHDATVCALGEGPLWHPERGELFWFDIVRQKLMARQNGAVTTWYWDEPCSAAGWVDAGRLLVATASGLEVLELATDMRTPVVALEADNPVTRANDGRADPFGGFWIGTMGRRLERDAGAIYRYYRGELRKLFGPLTIPNAICFTPDAGHAYFGDTGPGKVWRVALDGDGWPKGDPEVFLDLKAEGLRPDGAVVAADGTFWNAQWGAFRVAAYSPQGQVLRAVGFPAAQTSCPAFGGADLTTLFCTSAAEHLSPAHLDAHPRSGMTFCAQAIAQGQAEHRVIL